LRCGPMPPPDEEEAAPTLREVDSPAPQPGLGETALNDSKSPKGPRTPMQGTPVHQRLLELLSLLSPLTLPAPEDPDFRATNCKTVRDVARLAHQRAVDAMVDFGRSQQDFAELQAKQLWAGGAAMQWWIINLEDAFSAPPEGKFIRLENITSPPFQAVWAGISAVPWAGPPPVDVRGFLSIMYESTTNPEIGVMGGFDFGVQNHILLSRSYVSLSSRFGYHFVTIEALVGERARENFDSFQFRGGAAEVTRRTRRIRFVSGILAEFGFSLEARDDALLARVEGLTTAELMDRLKVLGYLIIHTRQLDMVMRIPEQVRQHREKILREVRQMLGHGPDQGDRA
ncbi:MAG: pyruvate, water dikinase, partial [Humidesulfovibrio sp.]|nr:pyruvate, water dikinase [Humidesulfovibrio sp.]